MRIFTQILFLAFCLTSQFTIAQVALRIDTKGPVNFPEAMAFQDTLENMSLTLFNDAPFPVLYENIRVQARINDVDSTLDLTAHLPSREIRIPSGDSLVVPLLAYAPTIESTQPDDNRISIWVTTDNVPNSDTLVKQFNIQPKTHPLWEEVPINFSTYLTNTERLFLDIDQKHLTKANARITDQDGNVMFSANKITKSIDIRGLQAGIYTLEISTPDGSGMKRLTIH